MRTPEEKTKKILKGDLSDLEFKLGKSGLMVYFIDGAWRTRESVIKKIRYKKSSAYKKDQAQKAANKRTRK